MVHWILKYFLTASHGMNYQAAISLLEIAALLAGIWIAEKKEKNN